ncbi:MAG: hypothetical protein ABIO70_24530 [Pseudomonadota bacterium]
MDTLLPVLRPAGWPDRAHCWARPLLPLPDAPLVTLTQQVQPLLVTLGPRRLALLGLTPSAAEARAIANLALLPAPWRALQSPTPRGGWLEIQVLRGPLAASRILDTRALAALGRQIIGADSLAVALPRADLLLATPAAWALDGDFGAVALGLTVGSPEPLSPRIFLVEGGVLVGTLGAR